MEPIFFNDAIEEFIYEYVEPSLMQMKKLQSVIQQMLKLRIFAARPFDVLSRRGQQQQSDDYLPTKSVAAAAPARVAPIIDKQSLFV